MLRFFATLLATGAAVLAASAWWGGREATSGWPPLAEPTRTDASAEPVAEGEREMQRGTATLRSEPHGEPAPRDDRTPPTEPAGREQAPGPATLASGSVQGVPSIPSPLPVPVAAHAPVQARIGTRRVEPEPALPEPIPAPFAAPPADTEAEETRISQPAPFTDEVFALGRTGGGDRYGEENVVWVEGDDGERDGGNRDERFADERGERLAERGAEAYDERALATSGHDASAVRIRRLLDVYESLGRWR